jgi:hypothetical protein
VGGDNAVGGEKSVRSGRAPCQYSPIAADQQLFAGFAAVVLTDQATYDTPTLDPGSDVDGR